jgi:pimeloyl-ACP methyl ester carboxylesterase
VHGSADFGRVLVNPGGLDRGGASSRVFFAAIGTYFDHLAEGHVWARRLFPAYYALLVPRRHAREHVGRITRAVGETAPRLRDAWRSFARPRQDARRLAASVHAPVLVVWGRKDRILRTIEGGFGLPCLNHACDDTTRAIDDLFSR